MKKIVLFISNKSYNLITIPNIIPFNSDKISIDILQNYSNLPKNVRFQNEGNYKYNLQLNSPVLILDYIFYSQYTTNHIYREDSKKETIDSLLE